MDNPVADAFAVAGLILSVTGFFYGVAGSEVSEKRLSFLRTSLAVLGVAYFAAFVAVVQALIQNVAVIAAVSAVAAVVGLYAPRRFGSWMTGRRILILGFVLVILSVLCIGVADEMYNGSLLSFLM